MTERGRDSRPGFAATLADGSACTAIGYDGALLHLVCEHAHPPGRPLELTLAFDGTALVVRGKSAGSRRRDDQRFDVRLRLHSLRREDRAQLERAFEPNTAS